MGHRAFGPGRLRRHIVDHKSSRYLKGAGWGGLYVGSIVLAAYLVATLGVVPVGLGLYAPAGAYVIGVTMVLRDLTQDQLGPKWTYAAILIGTGLAAAISPAVAVASAVAFLGSETLDMLVYTPLRVRGRIVTAILASNLVGTIVDSLLFLIIAFGSLEFFAGQVWAKLVATALAALVVGLLHARDSDKTPAYLRARTETANSSASEQLATQAL